MRFVRPVSPIDSASESTGSAVNAERHRNLGDGGGYLVDSKGEALEPYSLSWRYLGVFIDNDCNKNNNDNDDNGRNLEDGNDNNAGSCRKVLWAAYRDPEYAGEGIAEYAFYQREGGYWDKNTCRAKSDGHFQSIGRCRRLDCHEETTNLKLVGVFKETDGLYDFTEQLFKHSGYCLWDEDKRDDESGDSGDNGDQDMGEMSDYQFMKKFSEKWPDGCTQVDNTNSLYSADKPLYYDTKPLPGGDLTFGVYTDSSCTSESKFKWSDVLGGYNIGYDDDYNGGYNGGDNGNGGNNGMPSIDSLDRWNALLSDYKICQPCRAYNRVETIDESEDEEDYEDGDDGEGGMDLWGFNCYDDAGYRNCNQCYKFQTQTNMEKASISDLKRATAQGTILGIKVAGKSYGKGYYVAPGRGFRGSKWTVVVLFKVMALLGLWHCCCGRRRRKVGVSENDLEDDLSHRKRGTRGRKRSKRSGSRSRSRSRSKKREDKKCWKIKRDRRTGKTYFYNRRTKEISWDKPPGFDEERIEGSEGYRRCES